MDSKPWVHISTMTQTHPLAVQVMTSTTHLTKTSLGQQAQSEVHDHVAQLTLSGQLCLIAIRPARKHTHLLKTLQRCKRACDCLTKYSLPIKAMVTPVPQVLLWSHLVLSSQSMLTMGRLNNMKQHIAFHQVGIVHQPHCDAQ